METTGGKVLGSGKCTKLGIFDDIVLSAILVDINRIKLGFNVKTELGSLYGSFDGFNDGNIEELFLVGSLWSTHGRVIGSNEDIKMLLSDGKVLRTILVNVDVIYFGLMLKQSWDF